MNINKQNRALLVFFVLGLVALAFVLSRNGAFEGLQIKDQEIEIQKYLDEQNSAEKDQNNHTLEEPTGEAKSLDDMTNAISAEDLEARTAYAQILTDLGDCLGMVGGQENSQAPVTIETLIERYKSDLGQPIAQEDRSVVWFMRDASGVERRLRIENRTLTGGGIKKAVNLYVVGKDGAETLVELEPGRILKGDPEEINEILKLGDVFYKEGSSSIRFPGGQEIIYANKNDQISDLELVSGETFFRCDNMKARENCQCVK